MNKFAVAALTAGGLAVSMTGLADAPAPITGSAQAWSDCNDVNRYGYDIRTVQEQLLCLGYNPGPVDGCYGSRTRSAVKQFQRDNGLSVDGVVGNNTGSTLASAYQRCIQPEPVVVAPAPVVVPVPVEPAPVPAAPVDQGRATLNWFVEGGYATDIASDPVVGDDGDDDSLYAGDGIYGNVGMVLGHTKSALSAMLSVGYKYNEEEIDGDDNEFRSLPVNFLMFYNWERSRLGLGVTYKVNPDLTVEDGDPSDNPNESGVQARFDYFFNRGLYLGAVIEEIEYGTDDADNVGIHLGYQF